jgi:hypothetical protein
MLVLNTITAPTYQPENAPEMRKTYRMGQKRLQYSVRIMITWMGDQSVISL